MRRKGGGSREEWREEGLSRIERKIMEGKRGEGAEK